MPRRRMSLRAIARMKREHRAMQNQLDALGVGYPGTRVSTLTLDTRPAAEVKTAHTLGYITVLRDSHDGTFTVRAVKIEVYR